MNRALMILVVLFMVVYIAPLGVRPLAMPDETRYAEIPREMIASGNWVVPKLNGLLYFEKPVLGYWLNAVSILIFGENRFAVRLPAALAAGLSAFILFILTRRFAGGRIAGVLAPAIFLTCLLPFGIGSFAVLDSMVTAFVTGAMVSFFFAYMDQRSGRKATLLAVCGCFCGLAFLTKGFIAFAVPVVTIVPFLIWERQWKGFVRLPWIPLFVAAAIALPWAIAIHLQESDFWRYFVMEEHIERFLAADSPKHPEPFWFFMPLFIGVAMPWTLLIPAAVQGIYPTRLKGKLARFATCWLVFPFIFFSASRGKLGTYILPCFVPFAVLMTIGLLNYFTNQRRKLFVAGVTVCVSLAALLGLALLAIQTTDWFAAPISKMIDVPKLFGNGEMWKWLLALSGFVAWAGFLIASLATKSFRKRLAFYCLAPVLIMASAHAIVPNEFKKGKAPGEFLRGREVDIRADTILVSDNYMTPAVCWAYKRSDVLIFGGPGEFLYGLTNDPSRTLTSEPLPFRLLIEKHRRTRRVTLITCADRYDKHAPTLLKPLVLIRKQGFVFAQY